MYEVLVIATLLDPKSKDEHGLEEEEYQLYRSKILDKLNEMIDEDRNAANADPSNKRLCLEDVFRGRIFRTARPVESTSQAENELKLFEKTEYEAGGTLIWFEKNANRFPNVKRLSERYLIIQSSSCASERLFSAASRIFSYLRLKLSSFKGQTLIFLYANRFKWYK